MFLAVVLIRVLAVVPFLPVDESANVDYAMQLTHGRVPVAAVRINPEFPGQRHAYQHSSNHPPLYHAIVGPILRAALHLRYPNAGVLAARLATVGAGMVALVLLAMLARSLIGPERRGGDIAPRAGQLVVASTGMLALLATFITSDAIVQNDALATALALAALVVTVRIVRFGLTAPRLAGLCIASAAACLTRVTNIPVVAVAAATILIANWCWPRIAATAWPDRLRRAVGPALIVVVVTAAAAGWFVALNKHRYGDWTGGSAVDSIVHSPNSAAGGPISYLLQPESWLLQFTQLAGGPDTTINFGAPHTRALAYLLIGLLAAGLTAAGIRLAQRSITLDRRQLLCLAALALTLALSLGEIAVHATSGGGAHGRYLLPGAGAIGIGAAAALLCLPRRLNVLAIGVVLAVEGYGALYNYSLRSELHHRYRITGWYAGLKDGLADVGIPAPEVVLPALLAVAGAAMLVQLAVLWRLGSGASTARSTATISIDGTAEQSPA